MLEKKVFTDYQQALKNKDTLKSSVLSFLRAELINVAMAKKKKSLDGQEVITVIRKQVKARQESIAQFKQGNRLDLAEKETKEMQILRAYLPPELPVDEIKKIIEEAVVTTGAASMKDMGRVMQEVKAKVLEKADGKVVSDLVRERLSKSPPSAA